MSATAAQQFDTLDALVEHEMDRLQIPGMAVGILRDGRVEASGCGVISLATGYPTKEDTVFQIGSNTKVYTATLAMRLVEEGKLDLDVPISTYLPDLKLADPEASGTITMRHLFTHTSGLEGDRFEDFGNGDDALAKAIDAADQWAQETQPGEIWSYCNSGFYLAGRIIESILEKTYEEAMREWIFRPLGLERSFWFAHEAIVYSAAAGHVQEPDMDEPRVAFPYAIPRASNPAGAIISSVEDILTFLAFHMGDGEINGERLLTRASIEAMQQPQARVNSVQEWGIGWSLRAIDGVRILEHGGGTNGHITQMLAVPDRGFGIAILTNSSRGGQAIRSVERWALERYCGLVDHDPEPIELPDDRLQQLAGVYTRPLSSATISVKDGALQLDAVIKNPFSDDEITLPPVNLAPLNDQLEFIATGGEYEGMRAEFIVEAGDGVRFMRFGGRLAPRVD